MKYICTNLGAVKTLNIIIGVICTLLFFLEFDSEIPEEVIFAASQLFCLTISTIYLLAYVLWTDQLVLSKCNQKVDLSYHILGTVILIVSGIDVIRWSEISEICPNGDCPPTRFKQYAKILSFINGTLYGLAVFLLGKSTIIDPEFIEEDSILIQNPPGSEMPYALSKKGSRKLIMKRYSDLH